ncbi:MAG: histidinol-phosphatase HisJ family protein [Oscillospiraceae bacterium]|nr:histidinol-phosphatase HisJ family protein [Oscillospiraceae bacterium]
MIKSNIHTHTIFSDGKNEPDDIVNAALQEGFVTIGFSDHSFTPFDISYCMPQENYPLYKKTVSLLKRKYKDKIEILCGTEFDYYSPSEMREGFDYFITGVHYVKINREYYPVDGDPKDMQRAINEGLGGNENDFVRLYYENAANCASLSPLYMAHFDLLTKYGKINDSSDFYKKTALEALDALLDKDIPIEVNTGALAKGIKQVPYPADFLLKRIAQRKGSVIFGSDCHDMTKLSFAFEGALERVKNAGIKNILEYRSGNLQPVEL